MPEAPTPQYVGQSPSNVYALDYFINQGKYGWSEGYWLQLTGSQDPWGDIRAAYKLLLEARTSFLSDTCHLFCARAQQTDPALPAQLHYLWVDGFTGCGVGKVPTGPYMSNVGWWVTFANQNAGLHRTLIFHGLTADQVNVKVGERYEPPPVTQAGLIRLLGTLAFPIATPSGGTAQFVLRSSAFQPNYPPVVLLKDIFVEGPPPNHYGLIAKEALLKGVFPNWVPLEVGDIILVKVKRVACGPGYPTRFRITAIDYTSLGVEYHTDQIQCCPVETLINFIGYARVEQFSYYPYGGFTTDRIAKKNTGNVFNFATWAPTDSERLTAHPCGMVEDVVRMPYRAHMRFPGVADPVPVVWWLPPDGTDLAPFPSAFGTRAYSDPHGWAKVGEQYDYECCGRDYRPAWTFGEPAPYFDGPACGDSPAWRGEDAPVIPTNDIGQAVGCCETPHYRGRGGQREGGPALQGQFLLASGGQREGGTAQQHPGHLLQAAGGQREGGPALSWAGYVLQAYGGQREGGPALSWAGYVLQAAGGQREGGEASQSGGGHQPASGGQREGGPALSWAGYTLQAAGGQREGGPALSWPGYVLQAVGGQREGGPGVQGGGYLLGAAGGQREGGPATSWPGYVLQAAGGQREGGAATQAAGYLQQAAGGQREGGPGASAGGYFLRAAGGQREGGPGSQGGGRLQQAAGGQREGGAASSSPGYIQQAAGGQKEGGAATQGRFQQAAGGQREGGAGTQGGGRLQQAAGGQREGGTSSTFVSISTLWLDPWASGTYSPPATLLGGLGSWTVTANAGGSALPMGGFVTQTPFQQNFGVVSGNSIAAGTSKTFLLSQWYSSLLLAQTVGAANWTVAFAVSNPTATSTRVWTGRAALYLCNGSTGAIRTTIKTVTLLGAANRIVNTERTVYSATFAGAGFTAVDGDYLVLEIGVSCSNNSASAWDPNVFTCAGGLTLVNSDNAATTDAKSNLIAPVSLNFHAPLV